MEYISFLFNMSVNVSRDLEPAVVQPPFRNFCSNGAIGNLSISDFDVESSGEADDEWKLFELVNVDVEVENDGDSQISDVVLQLALFDSNGVDKSSDLDFFGGENQMSLGNINSGDDADGRFEFRVPINFAQGNYSLAVKTYSIDDGEEQVCAQDYFEPVIIEQEEDQAKIIQIEQLSLSHGIVACGALVNAAMSIVNLGDIDQDRIKVVAYINKSIIGELEITNELESGEVVFANLSLVIPSNIAASVQNISFKTQYDYRNGLYRQESNMVLVRQLIVNECNNNADLRNRILELEKKVDTLEKKTSKIESSLNALKKEFNDLVDKLKRFVRSPRWITKNWDKI